MFRPSNYTLPLNEEQGNDVQLQTDVEMKVLSEYTEMISASDADKMIEYEIITVGDLEERTFTNLENCVPIDPYDSQDSNSRCKMSKEELSATSDHILSDDTFNDNKDSIPRCKMSIEGLSATCYNDHILSDDTFNDNKDSIPRCKMYIEGLSATSYNDHILSDDTFNDNKDSIPRCKMSIEGFSATSYNDHILSYDTFNDNKDSIPRCKMSIEGLSATSYNDHILSDDTFNDNKDSIPRCKMSIEGFSATSYNDHILSDDTFNDNKDSIPRCKMFIEGLSATSYNDHILSDDTFNDNKDSIPRCKMSIEGFSATSYNDQILPDNTFYDNKDSISRYKTSIEGLSATSYNDQILSYDTFNDNKDSIPRCKMYIEGLSATSYNDHILSDDTFNDNKDSIPRCKMSIEGFSATSYNDHILSDDTFNDNKDSIPRCKMSIEGFSATSYNDHILSDDTFNDNKDSIPRCKMSIEGLSATSYNDQILSYDTFNDNKDSIPRCKMSIEGFSATSYNDQILSDDTFNDNKDSIPRCKMSIEGFSAISYNDHILSDDTFNDNKDSIPRCKMSIEGLSATSYNDQILSDDTFNDNKDSIPRCKMSLEGFSSTSYNDHILSDDTFNDNKDSIPRCKMSIEELSPSSNTNHVFKVKRENSSLDHLIECVIADDTYEDNKQHIKLEVSLDDAFRQCLREINSDLSDDDYNFDNVLKQFNKNDSSTETNHKRKILGVDELIAFDNDNNRNCSCGIPKDQSYFENTKKKRVVDDMNHIAGKTSKSCQEIHHNIFNEPEIEYLKKTYERFLQKSICLTLPPQIDKCIECRVYHMKNNLTRRDYDSITCRFYAFRQLRFQKSGMLEVAGYPDPHKNVDNIDLSMWLPNTHLSNPSDFNIQASTKILGDAGGQFCMFVKEEIDALKFNLPYNGKPRKILWKKCVNGVREMCDVCRTTIFNHHWCCRKCGFVVCVDCFKAKLIGTQLTEKQNIVQRNFNKKIWLLCSNQKEHRIEKLFITQILAGNALKFISELMHDTCRTHNILLDCSCNETLEKIYPPRSTDPIFDNLLKIYEQFHRHKQDKDRRVRLRGKKKRKGLKYFEYCDKPSTKRTVKVKSEYKDSTSMRRHNVEDTIYTVGHIKRKEWFPPKLSLLSDDKTDAPHMWLCEGHLLRLLDPKSDINYTIFQEQWRRGQPVLVSNVGNKLNSSLWHPESFSRDFGNQINDLIDCTTSDVISNQPMSKFWNGFENSEERLCDKQGNVMLLKLKDWPPSADFAETLPDRFQDLMNCLPLKEYTHRNGKYNLASHLPDCYIRPDLGPKMYTAYGNAGTTHKKVGTTNLHLDISDAVNVMVYVAITKNCKDYDYDWHVREAFKVIEEAGCDDLTLRRIYADGETPGALWHIYHASDADSIRDLLIKVSVEHGTPLEQFSDPIHDQSHYLDEYLRERLYREYGVKGYAIVQYYGDAVFIPAGAPHQVRNLHNCIKVAEDFVSPENVQHSFRMTQEFRHLTDSHTNHEDKLQIKNIVFHAVKDSISVLMHTQHKL